MKLSRNKLQRITENVIARLVNEGAIDSSDLTGVEKYLQGYTNSQVDNLTTDDLIKYCQNNEFLYIFEGMRGLRVSAANTNDIRRFIVKALYNCSYVKPTHDVDYLITDREDEFENCQVCIYEVVGGIDEPLYIVYQDFDALTESVLNEISPEKRAAAFVKANNYRTPEGDGKTIKKGNRVVDAEYEKERKQRQKDLFGNSVARDIGKELGVDRGQRNAEWIKHAEKDIKYYNEIINDPKSTEATRLRAQEELKNAQKKLRTLKDNTLGFSLRGNDDGYHLSYNGNVAYSNTDQRGFSYSNPKEANRAYQMQGITDRLMGLDDEMNQGRKLDGRVDYLKRRQKNVANTEKYYADKEDWENRKSDADAEMHRYKSKNPISRMFSKKPQPFNEPEPQRPEWDKGGGGVYFTGKPSDYDKDIADQENLNDIYRTANKKRTDN